MSSAARGRRATAAGVEPGLAVGPAWPDGLDGPGLDLDGLAPPERRAWLHSGRAALRWLAAGCLAPGAVALVPAYICGSLLAGLPLTCRFYHVDDRLRVDWAGLERLAGGASLLLLVHYFGRLQDRDRLAAFRARFPRVTVVEDLSHALLAAPGGQGLPGLCDYGLASLRKLVAVPDGALVFDYRGAGLPPPPARAAASPPSTRRRLAALEIEAGRASGPSLELFARAEADLDRQAPVAPASELTRAVCARLPVAELRERRRANWLSLRAALNGLARVRPLHDALPPGTAPVGFPVRCRDRHDLGRRLAAAGIETTVHWPLPSVTAASRDERLLAGTLLTLPCGPSLDAAGIGTVARLAGCG